MTLTSFLYTKRWNSYGSYTKTIHMLGIKCIPLGLNTSYTYNLAVMSSMRATTVDLVSFFSCPTMVRPR